MYRKYYEVWSAHAAKYGPKTALLYQVGGFFEIYDTENLTTGATQANIREIAELCQLSLTTHEVDGGAQTLFGGFPEHALGKFERILVQAGWTVVVVVQRKGATGAVEERVVDHIASPGCYVDGARERRLVGCILESLTDGPAALRRVYWAAAALDVATGRIWFAEGVDRDRLHQFLCMHPPAELVLWADGLPAANHWMDSLKTACAAVHCRCLGSAAVAVDEATLERFWAPARKRLEWLPRLPQARRALAALLEFATDHVPSALAAIRIPEAWTPDGEVRLGNAALEQLGLVSLRSDEKQSLLGLLDQCRSVAGRRLLRTRLMRPITEISELERRLDLMDRVGAASGDLIGQTERALRSLYDMSRLWRKLELRTATLTDMACLLRSYEAARTLLAAWAPAGVPPGAQEYLDWVFSRWDPTATSELSRLGPSVPVTVLPWVSTNPVFEKGRAIRDEAVALCASWSAAVATKGKPEQLYLDDAEGGGFRITGTKRRVASVLAALRDDGDTSAASTPYKASATVETAGLDAISTRHRTWMTEWIPVWSSMWLDALTEIVARGAAAHAAIEAWCAELDLAWTTARIARDWNWRRPVFKELGEGALCVTKLRHPILERIQTQVPYVAHTIGLGSLIVDETGTKADRGFLLYGMNASGKSSLMKAVGLAVLLAQCGFPVPAAAMTLSPFTAIFTRILGNDNLWAGLSSFAVEMTEFREILRYADQRALVLGDELCSGTESLSATALVAAGVETLAARGTKFVFATHLHELAALPDIKALAGVAPVHLKVHYDEPTDSLIYDRQLAPGSGSALYGLEVCRALDLPISYLDRATALRQTLAGWQAPHTSTYSVSAVVDRCAICQASGSSAHLEMHHIRPQADGAAAAAEGFDLHGPGNLACLCAKCHDEHHAGRLLIAGWEETSAGRRLLWSRSSESNGELTEEIRAFVREEKARKSRVVTIQRMATQLFGITLTKNQIQSL